MLVLSNLADILTDGLKVANGNNSHKMKAIKKRHSVE